MTTKLRWSLNVYSTSEEEFRLLPTQKSTLQHFDDTTKKRPEPTHFIQIHQKTTGHHIPMMHGKAPITSPSPSRPLQFHLRSLQRKSFSSRCLVLTPHKHADMHTHACVARWCVLHSISCPVSPRSSSLFWLGYGLRRTAVGRLLGLDVASDSEISAETDPQKIAQKSRSTRSRKGSGDCYRLTQCSAAGQCLRTGTANRSRETKRNQNRYL